MIEEIVKNELDASFTTIFELPEELPAYPFLVVQKTGGSESNYIKRSMIAVQSYGATLYQAAQTNEAVKRLMAALPRRNEVISVRLNADYNYTYAATKQYRYQAVFDITHY